MSDKPRILLFTGDGKGKTTAALGLALRAAGHGRSSFFLQFIKSDASAGEVKAAGLVPGILLAQTGLGFVPPDRDPRFDQHRQAAQKALHRAELAIASGLYPVIVLDEVCLAVSLGLLDESAVIEVVRKAPAGACMILTGRGATPGLMAIADTVTEMRCVKHAFQNGTAAQAGVEF
jgi:cob(I)alamin adenosyltransferase